MTEDNKKRILIVEDDLFLNSLLGKKLFEMGEFVFNAKSGEEMFEILKTQKVDIIGLDLMLPGMSGFDILRKLKEDVNTKDIPVVIVSNLGQKNDMEMGLKLGAKNFLVKALYSIDELAEQFLEVLK